jgi:hypothetical protein
VNRYRVNRRDVLLGCLGAASAVTLPGRVVSAATSQNLGLESAGRRAWVRAKIMASAGSETVYTFYRVHAFAYLHEGNLQPLFTTHVLNARVCRPQADAVYSFTTYEAGIVTRFDSDEPLQNWKNPYTGELVKVWPLFNGPLAVEAHADGIGTAAGLDLKPAGMRIDVMGDQVFLPTRSAVTAPNRFQPDEWPRESSGQNFYWDSHFTYVAPLAEVANPETVRSPAIFYLQNLGSWYPWMRMAQHPGRMYGRAFGRKLNGFDEIPVAPRRLLEARTPEIFDIDSWGSYRHRDEDYMNANRPG